MSLLAVLCVALRFGGTAGSLAAAALLAGYALFGIRNALFSFGTVWLITSLNPGIAPEISGASILRYLVFLAGFLSIFVLKRRGNVGINQLEAVTLLMSLFFFVHSLVFSALPMISILKVTIWTLAFMSVLRGWRSLTPLEHRDLSTTFFVGMSIVMLISWLFFFSPLGYTRNARGFQGIINHPQAFGTVFGVFAVWAFQRAITSTKPGFFSLSISAAAFLCVFYSQSRTAGFSAMLGLIGGLFIVAAIRNRTKLGLIVPGIFRLRIQLPLIIAVVGIVSTVPIWVDDLESFVFKNYDVASVGEVYEASRGGLIDRMLRNIQNDPFVGIGFGLPSSLQIGLAEYDPVFGLPISIPIEKGVLPLAVLEETGFLGATFFLAWVSLLITHAARGGILPISLALTALAMNFGEAVLFSAGGMGFYIIMVLGMAVSSPRISERFQTGKVYLDV